MSSIDTKIQDNDNDNEKEKTLANLDVTTEIVYDDDEIRPEDTSNLRRVAQSLPLAAGFILINEFCERFAYYGGSTPFQNYVQYGPDDPQQAGALGKGQSTATALQTFFTFFCYFTPMLGTFIYYYDYTVVAHSATIPQAPWWLINTLVVIRLS
ncbi:hypothetical protein MBANPS3_003450 [Mucor bainieri]